MQTQQSIALNKLFLSPLNQRQSKDGDDVSDLLPSIAAQGLLQRLVVVPATGKEPRGGFGVVAGGRRWLALRALVSEGKLKAKEPIDCLVIPATAAIAASIAENTQRKALHPVDQFLAFKTLVESGVPVEDVAATFGVTPVVVRRRLKLGALSPRLLEAYRADAIRLEQLMALTLRDDHGAQEAAWFDAPEWDRNAGTLRARLTQDEVRADQDRRAKYVGVEAYVAAGGTLRQDLFDEHPGYVQDIDLLNQLVRDKLEADAVGLEDEGWAAVHLVPSASGFNVYLEGSRLSPQRREPTKREQKDIDRLTKRIDRIDQDIEGLGDDADEAAYERLSDEREQLDAQLEAIDAARELYTPEQRAASAVVVSISRDGERVVNRGVVAQTVAGGSVSGSAASAGAVERGPRPVHSERLVRQLTAHRSAALQVVLAEHPHYALAALIDSMLPKLFQREGGDAGLRVTVAPCLDDLTRKAEDLPASPAVARLSELHQQWSERLPATVIEGDGEHDEATAASAPPPTILWLLEQPIDTLLSLLAYCVASCCDLTTGNEQARPAEAFAKAVGLDMSAWWQPTAASYFQHVPKLQVVAAVREACGSVPLGLTTLKKAALASEAERAVAGTHWLPPLLRAA